MEKLFGAVRPIVSVLSTFERIEVRFHRSFEGGVGGGELFIAVSAALAFGPRFLDSKSHGTAQFLPNQADLLVSTSLVVGYLLELRAYLCHLRVESRLGSRLLLRQELHCSLEIHLSLL
jgi:hypothetical protein